MKRIVFGILAATLALLVIAVPVLATYWAYLVIEETSGTAYSDLPVIALRNVTQLANYGIITSSGLDTRVLTGDGAVLPHMLADDRVLTVTDLVASEKKQFIFYTGATSLSSFPIIVGYGGNISTPDVDELEMGFVTEILASGYFNSANGSNKNILYKEEAFKMGIEGANNLTVQVLNATDTQWEMHYSNFTTGEHDVYVLSNGLSAYLYVDDFGVAKDTQNLFETNTVQCIAGSIVTYSKCFYDEGLYWVFYKYDADDFGYITSADGNSWSSATTFRDYGNETINNWDAKMRDGYVYFSYQGTYGDGTDNLCFRKGDLEANSTITWSANWQVVATETGASGHSFTENFIAIDSTGCPYIFYGTNRGSGSDYGSISKSSTTNGTWTAAGGYPFDVWSYGSNNGILLGLVMYPNSDKIFAVWQYLHLGFWANTRGNYYNGAAWSGVIEISNLGSYITSVFGGELHMAADDNDNLYFTWQGPAASYNGYLTIRHAAGTWEGPYLIAASSSPDLSYNEDNACLYVIYPSGSYIYAFTLDTIEMEFNTAVAVCARQATSNIYGTNPYENNIGFLMLNTNTFHSYLDMTVYQWNSNSNDWYWMMNNVMPYADLLEMAIDGVVHLEYEPNDIIHGNTIPDLSLATGNDGTINWGENPPGVSAYITPIQSDETIPTSISPNPNGTAPGDMVGPTGQPGSSQTLPSLPSHPLYPFLAPLATLSGIPLGIMWILFATFLVVMAMIVFYRYVPHLLMTVLIGGGLSAFFYAMGIYPFWVLIIFVIGAIAIIVSERMPSID